MQNDTEVERQDEDGEDGFTIQDIQKEGIIYIISDSIKDNIKKENNLESQNNSNFGVEKINNTKVIDENKILYSFFLNNKKIYSSSFLPDSPLYSVRKEIKNKIENSQNLFFFHNSAIVTKEEEFELEIKDISEENIIFLSLETPKEIKNIDPNKDEEEDITPFQEMKPKPDLEKPKKENKFYFEIENGKKFVKIFDPEENLSLVRVELKNQINDDIKFIYDGYEIDQNEEENYTLSIIQHKSKILLRKKKTEKSLNDKSTELTAAPSLVKIKPIKGSKLIYEKNGLKIYKYPDITFTQEEEIRAISLMVVGQTGSGKTTLLLYFLSFNDITFF
jgi:flagellar biosynthesis GTPase FlhF